MPDAVLTLIASVLEIPPEALAESDGADTLAQWDSLKTILLVNTVEVTYGITLSNAEIDDFTSVGAVRATLARHGHA